MKILKVFMLTIIMVPMSYAVNIEGINGVEILAIDGKKVKSSFFSKDDNDVEAGKHQIVVRYSKQFNNDELLESRPTIFSIDLQQDTQISVKPITNKRQAQKQIQEGLNLLIINDETQYELKNSDSLQGEGFMPYSDIEKLIVTYNQQNNIVLTDKTTDKTPLTSATATNSSDVQTQLISLYENASHEEKKAFRMWLIEQDMQ